MTRPLAVALAVALSACVGAEGAECEVDADCASDLICFADVCQAIGNPAGEIRLEVVPDVATGLSPAAFALAAQPLRLDLCPPSAVEGEVEGAAEVIASGHLPGLPTQRMEVRRRVEGRFALPLPAGSWDLRFELAPTEALDLPPPQRHHVEVPRCGIVSLDAIRPPDVVHRLRFVPVIDVDRDPRPRCGLVARVHDRRTGAAISRTLPIPVAEGEPCAAPPEGWILPFVKPESESVVAAAELHLGPIDGGRPTVAWTATPFVVAAPPLVDLGAVGVGEAVLERVRVVVQDTGGKPVHGARVRLDGRMRDGIGRFEPPLATEVGAGVYETWLLPGTYEVRVEPPPGLPAATARCVEPIEGGSCEAQFEVHAGAPSSWRAALPLPVRVRGRVVDAEGAPAANARVAAIPVGGTREAAAIADGAGRFELLADPGAYRLLVQPQGRTAAWRWTAPFEVDVDTRRDLSLPPAAILVGTVVAAGGTPVHGTLVRAWRLDDGDAPRVVGETLTDARGNFRLALPASE